MNELECFKILNDGDVKYNMDEVRIIRDLLTALATIEYNEFKEFSN